jgi:hypothetical protein
MSDINNIHQLLTSKKRLWNWSRAVIHNDYWQEFLAMAKAHVLNTRAMNKDSQEGVIALCEAFEELTEQPPKEQSPLEDGFGLDHSVDTVKPRPKKPTTEK